MTPDIVFHYCSIETLKKILERKSIRLGEIIKSNDYMEMKWLTTKILPFVIQEEYDKTPFVFPQELLGVSVNGERKPAPIAFQSYLEIIARSNMFKPVTFACCFSEQGDLLSQWRGYADDGYGISIGVNFSCLKYFYNLSDSSMIKFREVIYDTYKQKDKVRSAIIEFLDTISGPVVVSEARKAMVRFLFQIQDYSPICKNPAFCEEKEWRLLINFPNSTDTTQSIFEELNTVTQSGDNENVFSEVGCYVRNNQFVYYSDLFFDKFLLPFICVIYLGPKCKLNEKDIRRALEFYHIKGWQDIKIKRSEATYY